MKNLLFSCLILIAFANTSCKSDSKMEIKDGRMCFASTDKGMTSVIALEVEGEEVLGTYIIEITEKDKTIGDFYGKREDNVINATFDYWIEGQNQVEDITLTILEDKIQIERPGQVEINGELIDRDGGQKTTSEIKRTNCDDITKDIE